MCLLIVVEYVVGRKVNTLSLELMYVLSDSSVFGRRVFF